MQENVNPVNLSTHWRADRGQPSRPKGLIRRMVYQRVMKQKGWNPNYTILLITWMGWISIYLARGALPPVLPILSKELSLTHTQAGLLESSYLIGYIISKLPAGALSIKYGSRRVLALSMIGYGVSTLLISYSNGFQQIFSLRFLVGLFQGVHLPVSNALISDKFKEKQGRAIGFNESGPNIGNTIAFPVAVSILSRWGWRAAFTVLSLPAFLLALATLLFMQEKQDPIKELKETKSKKLREYISILLPYALAHATYNLVLVSAFTFIPSFLVEYKGFEVFVAGLMAVALPFTGIFAKLGSGFILERTGSKNAICGAIILSSVFIAFLVLFPSKSLLTFNLVVLGLTLYSFSPIIYSSTASCLPSGLKAFGLGVVTMFGNIVGAISIGVVGALIDVKGYGFTFYSISIVTAFFGVLILWLMLVNSTS